MEPLNRAKSVQESQDNLIPKFDKPERELIVLLMEGKNESEMADLLEVNVKTISNYVRSIANKIGVESGFGSKKRVINKIISLGLFPLPKNNLQVISDTTVEQRISLAQEQQTAIENDLAQVFLVNDFGLKIKVTKGAYGLPEYHISSRAGKELGMIKFSTTFNKNDKEINILEFIRFNPDGVHFSESIRQPDVVATLANMEKSKINNFVQSVLVALGGKKPESKAATAE